MYKSKLHQGKKRNFEVLDAIEFLHRVCLHIPGHYEALIRYYGHYANAARGKRKKLGLEIELPLNIIDDVPNKRVCRKSWAWLIYQVYETDPLQCPNPAELRSPLQGGIRALDSKFKICSKKLTNFRICYKALNVDRR